MKNLKWTACFLCFLNAPVAFSGTLGNVSTLPFSGHPIVQLGGFWSQQGKEQHININELIGDQFTVTEKENSNWLIGLGYYIDGIDTASYTLSYGINAFYLPKTTVQGDVIVENFFKNLSYSYSVKHLPIYAIVKSTIKTQSPNYSFTVDGGIGPNFLQTSEYKEKALDDMTIVDDIFTGHASSTFSASAGIAIKINQVVNSASLELGYRFFYLGQGHLKQTSVHVLNTLKTGSIYANAVTLALTV